jgi:hypothetical protein
MDLIIMLKIENPESAFFIVIHTDIHSTTRISDLII